MISLIYFYFLNEVAIPISARTVLPLVGLLCPLQSISLPGLHPVKAKSSSRCASTAPVGRMTLESCELAGSQWHHHGVRREQACPTSLLSIRQPELPQRLTQCQPGGMVPSWTCCPHHGLMSSHRQCLAMPFTHPAFPHCPAHAPLLFPPLEYPSPRPPFPSRAQSLSPRSPCLEQSAAQWLLHCYQRVVALDFFSGSSSLIVLIPKRSRIELSALGCGVGFLQSS